MAEVTEDLVKYLWNHQHVPFQYGHHDCSTFAAKWVDRRLGTNYLERIKKLAARDGFDSIVRRARNPGGYVGLIKEVSGVEPRTGRGWTPGAVVVFNQNTLETLGIAATRLVYAPGIDGVVGFDAMRITHYWSLECLS